MSHPAYDGSPAEPRGERRNDEIRNPCALGSDPPTSNDPHVLATAARPHCTTTLYHVAHLFLSKVAFQT